MTKQESNYHHEYLKISWTPREELWFRIPTTLIRGMKWLDTLYVNAIKNPTGVSCCMGLNLLVFN